MSPLDQGDKFTEKSRGENVRLWRFALINKKIFCYWVFISLDLGVQMHRAYVHELQCAVFYEISGQNRICSRRCDEKLSFFAEQLASATHNFVRRREYKFDRIIRRRFLIFLFDSYLLHQGNRQVSEKHCWKRDHGMSRRRIENRACFNLIEKNCVSCRRVEF